MSDGPASRFVLSSGTGDTTVITSDYCELLGWSLRESAGSAAVATVYLEDGDGNLVAVIELAADASNTQWFGPNGVRCRGGLAVDRQGGSTEGTIFYR